MYLVDNTARGFVRCTLKGTRSRYTDMSNILTKMDVLNSNRKWMQNGILRLIFKVHFCATALVIRFLFATRKYRLGPCIADQESICALIWLHKFKSGIVVAFHKDCFYVDCLFLNDHWPAHWVFMVGQDVPVHKNPSAPIIFTSRLRPNAAQLWILFS